MPRYLLTPSLHDNWLWYNRMDSKEKQDFLNTLLKIEVTDPDALARMKDGQLFEQNVYDVAQNEGFLEAIAEHWDANYLRCLTEVADILRGGMFQQRTMFDVRFFGMDFLVYGRIDVRKRDTIFDIKKTAKYEMGKYTESVQHGTYMIGEKCKKFAYLACDGETVYREDYALTADMEQQVFADYEELVDGIMADADFRRAYMENWQAFGDRQGQARNDTSRFLSAG